MNQIFIFATNYFNFLTNKVNIGGYQTYIRDLSILIRELGYEVTIIQLCNDVEHGQSREFGEIKIQNYFSNNGHHQPVFTAIAKRHPDALFILGTDQIEIHAKHFNSIQIQHGVAFDIPGDMIHGFWGKTKTLQFINKCLRCLKNIQRFNQARHTVCVDYNYYNWFRTLGTIRPGQRITVIPNFVSKTLTTTELDYKLSCFKEVRKIVFARRFVDYRGTLMFAQIIPSLLWRYPNIEITFAGSGPLEKELKNLFVNNAKVKFTNYDSAHSLEFHRQYDVAIVPTIFSEGTSLSLCEAMGAGCFPICTHVGGMTNIILDGFNGFSVYPSCESILSGLIKILELPKEQFKSIVRHAHQCAITTFSRRHWADKWSSVIKSSFS